MAISKIVTNSVDSGVTITSPVINTITSASATALTLQSAGTTAITVDTSQNVGIGTASPTEKLTVAGNIRGEILNGNRSSVAAVTAGGLGVGIDGSVQAQIVSPSSSAMALYTGGTERMRIDSSGNVLVGCTAVPNVGATPDQFGFSVSSTEAVISKNTSGTTPAVYIKTIAGASKTVIAFYNGVNNPGNITTTPTATAYATSSDYRLKENVLPMAGALDTITQLKPVTYNWKLDGSNGQGFIAHELQAVVPQCVHGEKDAVETYTDEEGNEQTRPKYQGIDTSFLVATLTAAIQEQQALIIQLQADVAALKGIK